MGTPHEAPHHEALHEHNAIIDFRACGHPEHNEIIDVFD